MPLLAWEGVWEGSSRKGRNPNCQLGCISTRKNLQGEFLKTKQMGGETAPQGATPPW
eukprot:CAMPEP_0171084364 /NCGR_PEP_ID=MMETSP0766_2-20121228/18271_1 /TAXON_ID=439317 /ORGANISM="Gambierdiscus australes, Strain CAWD 149" /LENGTH=56 /DNA_ID=CAMNT_0011541863 /DNA_START=67 /DNA_END=234 /DNA_ORIENTATION=-